MRCDLFLDAIATQSALARSMLSDPAINLVTRAVDERWYYSEAVPISVSGFNPLGLDIFLSRHSHVAWLLSRDEQLNERKIDWYLYELFFAAHDYVHIWCARNAAAKLLPRGSTWAPEDWESLRFLLLFSEAAATAAIDYWFLCRADSLALPLGGVKHRPITTSFRQWRTGDSLHGLDVFEPVFLDWLATGYCTGRFERVDSAHDCQPGWIRRELRVARRQRRIVNDWLRHLSDGASQDDEELGCSSYARMAPRVRDIRDTLWESVFSNKELRVAHTKRELIPQQKPAGRIDFRFQNVRSIDSLRDVAIALTGDEIQRKFFIAQYVSCFDWERVGGGLPNELLDTTGESLVLMLESHMGTRVGSGLHSDGFPQLIFAD